MDATSRSRLLFEKLNANNQRLKRDALLRRLPSEISHVLGNSPCIFSVQIDPILRRFLPFGPSGIGASVVLPSHYLFSEVSSETKLLARLPRILVPPLSGRAFLLFQESEEVQFEGQTYSMPDTPLFEVDFLWAAPLLKELWPFCADGLVFVERDLRAGVLIGNYIGHVPDDWNPREIFYEVAQWPALPGEPIA